MDETTNTQDTNLLAREPKELQKHVERNAELIDGTLSTTQTNFLGRFFPGQAERLADGHELVQLKTGFEYRRRALQMAVESKLQAVEEMCNHVLVTGKSEIRRQRQEFFAEQTLKLQVAMDQCAEQFGTQLDQRFQGLERLRHEGLRAKEEERLERSVEQFYAMLDQLGKEFAAIIHEGVSSGQGSAR